MVVLKHANLHAYTHACLAMHKHKYIDSYIHTYIHTYTFTFMHVCLCINIYMHTTYMHVYIHTCRYACIHTYSWMCVQGTHVYICSYINTYIQTQICMYVHTYMEGHVCLIHTDRQAFMFTDIHVYIQIYTFQPRNMNRVKYFHTFQICIFQISRIFILLEI